MKNNFKAQCMKKVHLYMCQMVMNKKGEKIIYSKMSTITTLQKQILEHFWNALSVVHIREVLKYKESFQEVKLIQH